MALLTRPGLLGGRFDESVPERIIKTAAARTILLKEARATPLETRFDVFLSHSYKHAREVRAIKQLFEGMEYSVYVDWMDDEELDRSKVTSRTAELLRHRITSSRCLIVHASEDAKLSRWVPWELGFADGLRRFVAVLPVLAEDQTTDVYNGVEYMGLYPYVDFARGSRTKVLRPWVNRDPKTYIDFEKWLKGKVPTRGGK